MRRRGRGKEGKDKGERGGRTLAEDVEGRLDDEQEHAAAGREPEHLGHEALVERREALLARDRRQPVGRASAQGHVPRGGRKREHK